MNFNGLLSCLGPRIVDKDGNNFILRGLGIGGFLVKEGYMLHTAAQSPSTIDAAIIDLMGVKAGKKFLATYEENYCNEKDIEAIAKLGFNSIRLPFHYKMLSPRKGVYREAGFKYLDKIISWCKKHDLYIILDMHCAPGSQNGQNISDDLSEESKLYTQAAKYHSWCEQIWTQIAKRYVNEDYVAGYDLINEPVLNHDLTHADLRKSYLRLTKAVRKVDSRHIIFIEGAHYSTNFEGLFPKWDDNMAYGFHKYWNPSSDDSIRRFLDLRRDTNAPLWLGESGENSNQWFYENIDLMEKHNIGWNWWTHKKVNGNTNIFNVVPPDDYQEILDYWNKKGPRPSRKRAIRILTRFLETLKIENCQFREDVYYAILRRDEHKPYRELILDDQLVFGMHEYDIGRNGQTYERVYPMRVQPRTPSGNRGREFRNDAIDIFADRKGYCTGLNEVDQWTTYTFKVLNEGKYDVICEVNGSGTLTLNIGEQAKTTKITAHHYTKKTLLSVHLTPGFHTLKLHVKKDGLFGRRIIIKRNN